MIVWIVACHCSRVMFNQLLQYASPAHIEDTITDVIDVTMFFSRWRFHPVVIRECVDGARSHTIGII